MTTITGKAVVLYAATLGLWWFTGSLIGFLVALAAVLVDLGDTLLHLGKPLIVSKGLHFGDCTAPTVLFLAVVALVWNAVIRL